MWSTRRLNNMDFLPLVGYASSADATGYPRPGDPPRSGPGPDGYPGAEARRRRVCLIVRVGTTWLWGKERGCSR